MDVSRCRTHFDFDPQRYPEQPGCYLMKDAGGKVIYVGKAKNLRRRLSTHFRAGRKNRRLKRLVAQVDEVEVILAGNETESLVLENNLIKHYRPRYNRMLKHKKSGYAYIVLTGEDYPRFVRYRKNRFNKELKGVPQTGAERRFGPYVTIRFRDVLLCFVMDSFRIRTCKRLPKKVCLRYELRRCSGVCEGKASAEEYIAAVNEAVAFLSQRHAGLMREMKRRMAEHAEKLQFEIAGRIRDQIETLERVLEKQVVERDVRYDQDVVFFGDSKALVAEAKQGAVQCLRLFDLDVARGHAEACEHFLVSRYARNCPAELIVNRLRDPATMEMTLALANHHAVKVTLPSHGTERELLRFCERNYDYRMSE